MKIFLIGASSQLGHAFLSLDNPAVSEVVALSRTAPPRQYSRTRWLQGPLPNLAPADGDADAIVSFGPLDTLAQWLESMPRVSATTLVATSSMSAVSKQAASVPEDRATSRRLVSGEQGVASACRRLGMRCTILRPTMIYGVGLDRNLSPIARRAQRWRVFPYPQGRGQRQPVHAEDVALAAARAVESPQAAGRIIEVGGGERLNVGEMFRRVRDTLAGPVFTVKVPEGVMPIAAAVVPRLRGALSRLDQDLVADNAELESILRVSPRGFTPTADTWRHP